MILDTLENSSLYERFHPSFSKAFAWLRAYDQATPDGRYEIAPGLTAIVQRYETAPEAMKKWETHRAHGDIQYLVSGQEQIGQAKRELLTIRTLYNPEKDAEFYEPPTFPSTSFILSAGSFAVFLPHDAHQPGVMVDNPAFVIKVVVKFRL
jgi:YhcH/YjgK/YiaL family protein